LYVVCDNIRINKDCTGYVPIKQTKCFYDISGESNIKTTRSGHVDPVLKLNMRCDVMITEIIDLYNGLANCTRAKLTRIIIKQQSDIFSINIRHNTVVKGMHQYQVHLFNTYQQERTSTKILI
jgi:hypothetical protein